MTTHRATLEWSLDGSTPEEFLAGDYSRGHKIGFDEGVELPASASPLVVGSPFSIAAAADPEELLVAATASCHMLWFLDFTRREGLAVARYHDEPQGQMGKMADGSIGVVRIILRPRIEFTGAAPSAELMDTLHHKAHAACNIANSVKSEVIVENSGHTSPSP